MLRDLIAAVKNIRAELNMFNSEYLKSTSWIDMVYQISLYEQSHIYTLMGIFFTPENIKVLNGEYMIRFLKCLSFTKNDIIFTPNSSYRIVFSDYPFGKCFFLIERKPYGLWGYRDKTFVIYSKKQLQDRIAFLLKKI